MVKPPDATTFGMARVTGLLAPFATEIVTFELAAPDEARIASLKVRVTVSPASAACDVPPVLFAEAMLASVGATVSLVNDAEATEADVFPAASVTVAFAVSDPSPSA